jgi:predicted nucleic acid-binding protein
MNEVKIKVYADTSVFGGVFDDEFTQSSKEFFQEVKSGRFLLVTSAVVQAEILSAPEQVQEFFYAMSAYAEVAELTLAVLELRQAYLNANIVTQKSLDDATHVALASISSCDMIVSWNFKHIVHFEKIPKYNAVNTIQGYGHLNIFSPSEVIQYDD